MTQVVTEEEIKRRYSHYNLEAYEFIRSARRMDCHCCHNTVLKNEKKVKADLGRTSTGGHRWWFQFCMTCGVKIFTVIRDERRIFFEKAVQDILKEREVVKEEKKATWID